MRLRFDGSGGWPGAVDIPWWYSKIPPEELCVQATDVGLTSVGLLEKDDWPTVERYGFTCAMANGTTGIGRGRKIVQYHFRSIIRSKEALPKVFKANLATTTVFLGNGDGLSDREGISNYAGGIGEIVSQTENFGVTICMELLKSIRNHKDYQCDRAAWGVHLVE